MRTKFFFIGPLGFYSRDVIVFISYIFCIFFTIVRADKEWISPYQVVIICLLSSYATILGGQLPSIFFKAKEGKKEFKTSLYSLKRILQGHEGGLYSVGGLLGACLAVILLCKILSVPVYRFLDLIAPSCALGMSLIRLGCFFNGCCYGVPTNLPWAVRFEDGIPRHPAQIYLSLANFVIFVILLYAENIKPFFGFTFLLSLLLFSLQRVNIDFLRYQYKEQRKFLGGILTGTQLVYLIIGLSALVALLILNRIIK